MWVLCGVFITCIISGGLKGTGDRDSLVSKQTTVITNLTVHILICIYFDISYMRKKETEESQSYY